MAEGCRDGRTFLKEVMDSRTKNTKRNIISGFMRQGVNVLLPFLVRTTLLYVLGERYLGLDSLFVSILGVLNLAELGFSSAVTFVLYQAVAKEDSSLICALLAFLRYVYRRVGFFILVVGLLFMPFLPYLIKGGYPEELSLYILYIIYLFNTVASYWLFAYKQSLIHAMQREDLINKALMCTKVCTNICQILSLLLFENYYLFILFLPVGTVMNNLYLQFVSKKYFSYFIPAGELDVNIRHNLVLQVYGLALDNIGGVARGFLGSIVISATVGLSMVAIYTNYNYIFAALCMIGSTVACAMQASVGNRIASESREKNYEDLLKFSFIFEWLCGLATICLFCLYQPFMYLWTRCNSGLMLSNFEMGLFVVMFYVYTMNSMRNLYVSGRGLYWESRRWYVVEAIANIILSLVLGIFFGISGIVVTNIATLFLFNFVARTEVLFRKYFLLSTKEFYKQHLQYVLVTSIALLVTYCVCGVTSFDGIPRIIYNLSVCLVVPNFVYFCVYKRTERFSMALGLIRRVLSVR